MDVYFFSFSISLTRCNQYPQYSSTNLITGFGDQSLLYKLKLLFELFVTLTNSHPKRVPWMSVFSRIASSSLFLKDTKSLPLKVMCSVIAQSLFRAFFTWYTLSYAFWLGLFEGKYHDQLTWIIFACVGDIRWTLSSLLFWD